MKRLKKFTKRHKIKIALAFTLVAIGVGVFLLWFLHFRKLSEKDIEKRLNTISTTGAPPPLASSEPVGPDAFTTDLQFIPRVRDQGSCGSCTTFAMAYVLAISFNKQNRLKDAVSLSPQLLLTCRTKKRVRFWDINFWTQPCFGFVTKRHAQYLQQGYTRNLGAHVGPSDDYNAMPLYDDLPYKVGVIGDNPSCVVEEGGLGYNGTGGVNTPGCDDALTEFENTCSNVGSLGGRDWVGFRVKDIISISSSGDKGKIDQIKRAIIRYGCVAMNCNVYDNLTTDAQSSPYEYDPSEGTREIGGHAVTCVGWKPGYWLILNSWGREWGCSPSGSYVPLSNGYFYLKFGYMEDDVFAVTGTRVMMPGGRPNPVLISEVDETVEDNNPVPAPPPPPKPRKRTENKKSGWFCTIL